MQRELPHFTRPSAVVIIFMTTLFGRNLDEDRPHLGPGLVWLPGVTRGRLRTLVQAVAPYRSDATVERGIGVTREVLRATVDLAAAQGASALILVPTFGVEDPVEEALRRRLFDGTELPFLQVAIDPASRVPGDLHPDAKAAHEIAVAVAARLNRRN